MCWYIVNTWCLVDLVDLSPFKGVLFQYFQARLRVIAYVERLTFYSFKSTKHRL